VVSLRRRAHQPHDIGRAAAQPVTSPASHRLPQHGPTGTAGDPDNLGPAHARLVLHHTDAVRHVHLRVPAQLHRRDDQLAGLCPTAGQSGDALYNTSAAAAAYESSSGSGSVPATLALNLGAPATFGGFQPGVDRTYSAPTTATVTSTEGDATLTTDGGRLANGTFSLRAARGELQQVELVRPSVQCRCDGRLPAGHQRDRTAAHGSYSKTLTFTPSTHDARKPAGRRGVPCQPA
jgi:hypothetical protein